MKFCKMPFEQIYVGCDNGNITPCPWMYPDLCQVGYLYNENGEGDKLEDLLKSPKMQELRNSILDGSFKYCRFEACPMMQRNEFEDRPQEEIDKFVEESGTPKFINLAYDFVCNQSCPTCRSSVYIPPQDYEVKMKTIEKEILPYINKTQKLSASGMGDPFASPYMLNLISQLKPERDDFELTLETNGVFFDEEHWKKIEHLKKYKITITLTANSYDEFIYNQISRGGNLKKLIKNLHFIKSLREKEHVNFFQIAFVTQDKNFRELPSFCERSLNEFGADRILLRPVYQWGRMTDKEYWFKDILNPLHPYHCEYLEILKNPILHDPRVYNFAGDSEHPARDFYLENRCCCEKEKEEKKTKVKPSKKFFAHVISSLIPSRETRRYVRNKLLQG